MHIFSNLEDLYHSTKENEYLCREKIVSCLILSFSNSTQKKPTYRRMNLRQLMELSFRVLSMNNMQQITDALKVCY